MDNFGEEAHFSTPGLPSATRGNEDELSWGQKSVKLSSIFLKAAHAGQRLPTFLGPGPESSLKC